MNGPKIIIVGGGAAGFFAAITAAEAGAAVTLLERSPQFLGKVRISGGGRCNVTHACFDRREFTTRYPRGERELIGAFQRFGAAETVAWFEARGVVLKTEDDGRMFPVTDQSQTILDCLQQSARAAGVILRANCHVATATRGEQGGFELTTASGERMGCDRLLLASGGCRGPAAGQLAVSLGHALVPPVPSLFTFQIELPWLRTLAGVAVADAEVSVPGTPLRERGPVLVTHAGLSGPAILRLSAWGARPLHALGYRFPLDVNWAPALAAHDLSPPFTAVRAAHGAKRVVNAPPVPLPARLWEQLVLAAGVVGETRWSSVTRAQQHTLARQLTGTRFAVTGKTLNQDEFVTCGGVRLAEVNFKTMESRVCPGLYFAGELLDLDGITGGFNFQAAWTSGWLAGRAMARLSPGNSS